MVRRASLGPQGSQIKPTVHSNPQLDLRGGVVYVCVSPFNPQVHGSVPDGKESITPRPRRQEGEHKKGRGLAVSNTNLCSVPHEKFL